MDYIVYHTVVVQEISKFDHHLICIGVYLKNKNLVYQQKNAQLPIFHFPSTKQFTNNSISEACLSLHKSLFITDTIIKQNI